MFKKKDKDIDKNGVNEIIHLSKNILKLMYIVLIVGIVLAIVLIFRQLGIFIFIGKLFKVLSPLFIGFVIAWLFSPLVDKLTNKGFSRIVAAILVYLGFILFLIVIFKLFVPLVYDEVNELIKQLPSIITKITGWISDLFGKIKIDGINMEDIKNGILASINNYGAEISVGLPQTIVSLLSSMISGIGTILFGLIIGLYMLFDFNNLSKNIIKMFPKKNQCEIETLLTNIGVEVRKSVYGTLTVASMVFICDTVGFAIIGLKAALLFGLFCGITDLIPFIGPYIGTIVATIIGFTQNPLIGIGVLIITLIVQVIENYFLQPIVMSRAINLHPVTIIMGLLLFGYFFGIVGMILATPVLSILKVLWQFTKEKYNLFDEAEINIEKENG